ncbi:MAG: 2-oxo acid dehydrogenase subunit E2 [Chloroflexi bacterium]|nr:2-oxo acid dehydrogenase subunit E2 [Chloroflexota bacterium]
MATKIIMPQLGESVVEGTVSKWLKNEGDTIKEFDPIMEVATDKVTTEVTASASGTLLKILVAEGITVAAGTLLGWIGQQGEALVDSGEAVSHAQPPISNLQSPTPNIKLQTSKELGFISPVVAKLAAEHKVDLAQVNGTGINGRITKKDVLAFVESNQGKAKVEELAPWERPGDGDLFRPPELQMMQGQSPITNYQLPVTTRAPIAPPSVGDTTMSLSQMRKSIAEHMVRSKHTSPHVTTVFEVDMSKVTAHREANKAMFARDGVNLTFTAYLIAAIVPALKAYPMANSVFAGDSLLLKRDINIGMAVSLGDDGLIVPVIKRADEKSLLAIARDVNDLANRARSKQLKPDETQGGTFTLTNHGISGSLFATPIINQPQCGILGAGAIQKRVVVINDAIAIRPMMYLSFAFDHRILDGATADYFVAKIKEVLEGWG